MPSQPSNEPLRQPPTGASLVAEPTAAALVAPFVVYLLGTNLAGRFEGFGYAVAYAVVVGLTASVAWWLLRGSRVMRLHLRIGWGVVFGVIGIALWIWLSHLKLEERLASVLPTWLQPGPRASFNPFEQFETGFSQGLFIVTRLLGLALVVPWIEELFWRGFLLRWIMDPEWERVPIGEFTWRSSAAVVALFTLAHPEWLAAAVYCTMLHVLLHWKRDLWQCVVAHAVSNLLLGIYVLVYHAWWLW
jgi:uncharacterized protein